MSRIEDVAALAGVSMKTVSRVLNGEPHVREVLRVRVKTAAAELGYKPNQAARRLAGRRSFLIALMYHNPALSYVAAVQAGAARKCRELGYHLVVESLDERLSDYTEITTTLIDVIAPDGVILIPPIVDSPGLNKLLESRETPVARIAAGTRKNGVNIYMDDRAAGREMTEHLIGLGHQRIGIIRGPDQHKAAAARFEGYCDALEAAGIPQRKSLVGQGDFHVESGREAGLRMLSQASRPTAIFAANDNMALGVMAAARELGLSIPGDLSVSGFDDSPVVLAAWPALTTVRQPMLEMGAAAVEALLSPPESRSVKIDYDLVIRQSTSRPSASR